MLTILTIIHYISRDGNQNNMLASIQTLKPPPKKQLLIN